MIWVFTGESALTPAEDEFVRQRLTWLSRVALRDRDTVVTGAAYGVDSVVALFFREHRPTVDQHVYYPLARHNQALVARAKKEGWAIVHRVEEPYAGARAGACYMARNSAMINHGPAHDTTVVAFPRTKEERIRSGTWATVRRGRTAGVSDEVICALSSAVGARSAR